MHTSIASSKIKSAYNTLKPIVRHTPLQLDFYLSQKYQCNVYLKREDLQIVRSFKLRGAYYAISQLPLLKKESGITCASAGNHAQGVAYTCKSLKIKGIIFMPITTPSQKISQVQFFGGKYVEIKLVGESFDDCLETAQHYTMKHNMSFIPPFDSENVIAGKGTVAMEIIEDSLLPIDYVIVPIGGGGLISGVGSFFHEKMPQTKIVGVEPSGAASMSAALSAGKPVKLQEINKFVDGAAVAQIGEHNYEQSRIFLEKMILVSEDQVCSTILEMYTKLGIVVEPAGALSITALDEMKSNIIGKNIICIVSGGNNDINRLEEIKERSLRYENLQ
ncbi:hypothetical protein BFC19_04870 [Brochothrix thermosphacta]|uniref:threonine ammonia-lyase IlvA n=1 Tax=Brochothrix thermosphacta TaxID=2756 RepID=UPI000E7591D4|nr:threonine ammonia-lyase IlvA [Brochothrix thermosphacta]ANZ94778.1 hypothetical protein BFC19_04870 [Brochothrix thermosphacta]